MDFNGIILLSNFSGFYFICCPFISFYPMNMMFLKSVSKSFLMAAFLDLKHIKLMIESMEESACFS